MKRGTTPTISISVEGVELSYLKDIYISVKQDNNIITKTGENITIDNDSGTIGVYLTQDETLSFRPGYVFIQLRATTTGGNVIASDVQQISIDEILQEGSIT